MHRLAVEEDVDALEQGARSIAARQGRTEYGAPHMLAALLGGTDSVSRWLRSSVDIEQSRLLQAAMSTPIGPQLPVSAVRASTDVAAVYRVAADVAARAGRSAVSRYDVALALVVVPAAHTQYLLEREGRLLRALRRSTDAPPDPEPARGSAHRFLDGLAVMLRAGASGAVLVFFGAGLVLRRGIAHILALFSGIRVGFSSIWNSDEHGLYTDRAVSYWTYVRLTLLTRLALFATSVAILFRIMLEMRGLGVVPWPALTSGARELDSADYEASIGAEVFFGSYSAQIWIAAGAAFFSMPSAVEVSRVRQWSAASNRHHVTQAVIRPLDLLARLAGRFDGATAWLGAPVAVASGILSCIAAVLLALLLVVVTMAVVG